MQAPILFKTESPFRKVDKCCHSETVLSSVFVAVHGSEIECSVQELKPRRGGPVAKCCRGLEVFISRVDVYGFSPSENNP